MKMEGLNEPARLKEQLLQYGVKAASAEVDLSRGEQLDALLDKVSAELGEPDILVNNAAYSTNNDYSTLARSCIRKADLNGDGFSEKPIESE